MPTPALNTLLDPEFSKVEAKEQIELASPVLREIVNYSTRAFGRFAASTSSDRDVDFAVLALHRHMIEATDGVEVLVSQCCPDAAAPLLRSSFEALLSIRYIVETDDDYRERGLACLVHAIRSRIQMYEMLDPETERGRQYRDDWKTDQMTASWPFEYAEVARRQKANLEKLLQKPHLTPLEEIHRKLKPRRWYGVCGRNANAEQLARHLAAGGRYGILYRVWSKTIHSEDLISMVGTRGKGNPSVRRIRDSGELKQTALFAASFLLDGTRSMMRHFRPEELDGFSEWYSIEVAERYRALAEPPTVGRDLGSEATG